MTQDRCSVLADDIIRRADLDAGVAAGALSAAKAAYAAVDIQDADAYREATDRLISAQAMVDSLETKRN